MFTLWLPTNCAWLYAKAFPTNRYSQQYTWRCHNCVGPCANQPCFSPCSRYKLFLCIGMYVCVHVYTENPQWPYGNAISCSSGNRGANIYRYIYKCTNHMMPHI